MSRRLELLLFALTLIIALVLRLYDLRAVPPGAQHDEVFSANFATQILNGARPVYFDQNGGVMALYAYLIAPMFAAFGQNIVTLRLVSVACGLLTILFTYLLARNLFGVAVALISGALLSVCFWPLFESRVGLEPVSLMLMASATAWLFAKSQVPEGSAPVSTSNMGFGGMSPTRALRAPPAVRTAGASRTRAPAVLTAGALCGVGDAGLGFPIGVLLGLTTYTYHAAPLVFVSLIGFSAYQLIWQRAYFKTQWRSLALMFAVATLVMAPLAIHILTTAGDATSRTEDLSLDMRAALDGDMGPLADDLARVLGMFAFTGDPSWRYNVPGRPVFGFVMGLLAYIGLALALKRWRDPRYAFVVIWIACNVLASAVTRSSPSFLRSSAALPFIVMLPGIAIYNLQVAISQIANRKPVLSVAEGSQIVTALIVLLLITWEGLSTTHDYFTVWPNLERVRNAYRADLAEIANFLDEQKPAGTVMLSARFPADLDQEALYLLQRKRQRYQWFNGRRVLVFPDDRSGQGVSYFIPATNESLFDGASLLKTLDARAGPLDEKGRPFFTLYYLPDDELQRLRTHVPQIPLHANGANEMDLIGIDVNLSNRNMHALLYWRVTQRVRGDFNRTIFLHLLDPYGVRRAQEDRPTHPTSSWQDDDIVWQWFDLKLPDDAPAGDYGIELGIYDANAAGQPRVPILDAHGNVMDDHVKVGPFSIR